MRRALLAIDSDLPSGYWTRLGDEGVAVLTAIVANRAEALALRRRAVVALGASDAAGSCEVLERLVADPTEDEVVRRYAIRTLARVRGFEALGALLSALGEQRSTVRYGAVLAAGELLASEAARAARRASDVVTLRGALVRAREREQERYIIDALDGVLGGASSGAQVPARPGSRRVSRPLRRVD